MQYASGLGWFSRLYLLLLLGSGTGFEAVAVVAGFQDVAAIGDYVALLERIFLIERLQPWHSSRASRLVKTPKLHLCDTDLACSLLGVDGDALAADRGLFGHVLETFALPELRRPAS